jgi:uncharacterized protein DUF4386
LNLRRPVSTNDQCAAPGDPGRLIDMITNTGNTEGTMKTTASAPRFLGVAFLFVLVASALGSVLSGASAGTGNISSILAGVASHSALYRSSILAELATSAGIVVLAVLLYEVLGSRNRLLARIALGWWLAEAIVLSVSQVGAFATILLSNQYVAAAASQKPALRALGDSLYNGIEKSGYNIHMLFYCVGAVIWFYLFYAAELIPRWLALWGLIAETIALAGILFALSGAPVGILFFAHIALLELVIGLWLVIKGVTPKVRH